MLKIVEWSIPCNIWLSPRNVFIISTELFGGLRLLVVTRRKLNLCRFRKCTNQPFDATNSLFSEIPTRFESVCPKRTYQLTWHVQLKTCCSSSGISAWELLRLTFARVLLRLVCFMASLPVIQLLMAFLSTMFRESLLYCTFLLFPTSCHFFLPLKTTEFENLIWIWNDTILTNQNCICIFIF